MNQPTPSANPCDPLQTPATLLHPSGTLSALIESYLTRLEADGKSPHTLSCYGRDLRLLLGFAGDIAIADLTADLLARFLLSTPVTTTRTGAPRSEASMGRIKACLKSFGRFLANVGATGRDPAAWIRIKRHQREAPQYLSPTEVKALVKAVRTVGDDDLDVPLLVPATEVFELLLGQRFLRDQVERPLVLSRHVHCSHFAYERLAR